MIRIASNGDGGGRGCKNDTIGGDDGSMLTVIMVIMMYALVLVVKTMTMVLMIDRY